MKKTDTIYGLHASLSAINNKKRNILKCLCTKEVSEKIRKKNDDEKFNNFKIVDRKYLDTYLKNKFHQGIMVECEKLDELDHIKILDKYSSTILILDSLTDSQNVGAIIRSAYLFGISLIFYNDHNSFDVNSTLIKSASGAFEKVNLVKINNLNNLILFLKKKNYWVVGLDSKCKLDLNEVPNEIKKVIVLGSESKGIRKLIKNNCDYLVKIPMKKKDKIIDSLNVSNTASIVFYELSRHIWCKK